MGKKSGAEGDFVRKENCRYRKRSYKNKATPSGINAPPRRRRGGQDLSCPAATRRQGKAGSPGIYSLSHGVGLTTPPSCLWQDTVSRGGNRAAPLPTHLLRICAGALKCPEQWGIPKLESGQSPTSSRQGVLVCGALRLPHDLICLPLLFPQNSLRDFCGNPERQESARSPLTREG